MKERVDSEVAYVLFLDIVAYSLMPLEGQAQVASRFKEIVRRACADEEPAPLAIDTGDGAALVFFGGPSSAIDCAVRVVGEVSKAGIEARAGLHCGPVARVPDVNSRPTVSGPAINIAERVMRCADSGQILLSGAAADLAAAQDRWQPHLEDLGDHDVKHGVRLRLFNLVTGDCGRSGFPERLRAGQHLERQRLNNFTEPERPFIGRVSEKENLRQRIESDGDRLLTITGPGGIGKTRLAIEVAKALAPNYADGAWVVECDVLAGAEDLVARIASVLGLELGAGSLASLREALNEKQMLLVLDSFERIVAHATVVEDLLKHAPELQMIVTSRALLSLPREKEFVLGPLSTHREGGATADAIALFVGSARAAVPAFRITRQNRELIEGVVKAVEAVPLAIVLAAGRLRHMSLAELFEQLGTRPLEILKRKAVGEDRHANLSRVVDDSFVLLREDLKDLLIALSVFRGGFRMADAEAVVGEMPGLLDGISELRDNSLLSAQAVEGQMRYRSLDVIADYVEGIADLSRLEPLRRRHAAYFAQRAAELRSLYEDGRWREANAGLGAELGNYRRAIDYAVGVTDEVLVRSLTASLCRLLMEAGYRADFEKLVTAGHSFAEGHKDLPLLIETTGLIGGVHRRDRDFERAEKLWLRRAEHCARARDYEKEADTWLDLADMALLCGDPSKADLYLDRFAGIETHVPKGLVLASGYVARAKAAARKGDAERAKGLAQQALVLAESLPHRMHSFYIWTALAEVFIDLGEPELSDRLCQDGIRETLLGRHFAYTGVLLLKQAISLEMQGRIERAAEALAIAERIPKSVSQTLREQVMAQRAAFSARNGSKYLIDHAKTQNALTWQLAAQDLVDSLTESLARLV